MCTLCYLWSLGLFWNHCCTRSSGTRFTCTKIYQWDHSRWHTSALSGKVPFQKKILTSIEEHLGQNCQISNTLSDSNWGLEEGEEDLHTAHLAAVSFARSKPMLDRSTTLVCDEMLVPWASHHRNTDVRAGIGLLFSSFPFTTPFSPSTAVLFPTVFKISRFVLNVKKLSRLFHFPWGRLFYIQIDFTVKQLCPFLFSCYQFQCCCLNNSFPLVSWCKTHR